MSDLIVCKLSLFLEMISQLCQQVQEGALRAESINPEMLHTHAVGKTPTVHPPSLNPSSFLWPVCVGYDRSSFLLNTRLITFTCFKNIASFIKTDSLISQISLVSLVLSRHLRGSNENDDYNYVAWHWMHVVPVSMVPNASDPMTYNFNDVGDNHVDDDKDFNDDGETGVKYGIKASLRR